uniref:Small ribosomal subunit protein uS8c n=1 Tax=Chlamydomonas applanata TaxID=35704 RepID=A0A0S2LPQ4_CHLAP|nr:ribosomal protein S8 [Chlamydomonas applanata]
MFSVKFSKDFIQRQNTKNMITSVTKGFIHDSISDMLTRIRNACLTKKSNVVIPHTKLNVEIAQILEKEGFILGFQMALESNDIIIRLKYRSLNRINFVDSVKENRSLNMSSAAKSISRGKTKESCITNLQRISKPGLRIYANSREIPRILGGTGIVILSTPTGIMTDREARLKGIGGELLCSVW